MKKKLSLAVIQPHLHWEQPEANLSYFNDQIALLGGQADLVVLPETFSTGFTMNVEQYADREQRVVNWMKEWASRYGHYLAGSCIVKEDNHYYNRLYVVSPGGGGEHYDKRHLFRMGREQTFFSPGNRRVITKIGDFNVLLQICYDLRFPVFARNRGDYEAILYVANWPSARKKAWETLLEARAIENQAYVIAANCTGTDGIGVKNCGGSRVIDPKGQIKTRLYEEPGILKTIIDPEEVQSFRRSFPAQEDADHFTLL